MSEKRFKIVPEMEGVTARWYAKQRGSESQRASYRKQARELTAGLPEGARVLEVAPGPGFLAIEIARLGRYRVTGLDISRSFVELATGAAREAGVEVDFQHGDAANMPFDTASFDLIISQAAFKNFTRPGAALDEMHRVLSPGGRAVIQDLSRDATRADIDREIRGQALTPVNAFVTKFILGTMLRRRAYTRAQFADLATRSAFHGGDVHTDGIELQVRLTKAAAPATA